jgi:hypothetical protein
LFAITNLDVSGFSSQARAFATWAGFVILIFRELFSHCWGVSFSVTSLKVSYDALEGVLSNNNLAFFI